MPAAQHIPQISVILPVYNAEKYLREAIDSVIRQTFRNFELIIINDGSTDGSDKIISSYKDPRIISIKQSNVGLAATLNKGIEISRGTYIARQDNDDISLPTRLQEQFDFMESHENVLLLGTCAEIIDNEGQLTGRHHDHSTNSLRLKFALLFDNPFVHSSVMLRRSVTGRIGMYDQSKEYFEDHNYWSRIAREGMVANLKRRLLKYREVHSGMSQTTGDYGNRVKNQAIKNIHFYCPELKFQEVNDFLDLYLNLVYIPTYQTAYNKVKESIDEIGRCFVKKESAGEFEIRNEKEKLLESFRRRYYSAVIQSDQAGFLKKLNAKIRRKLMLLNQN